MSVKNTITRIFIMPTLKIGKDKLMSNGFLNGYVKDKEGPDYEDAAFILFKPSCTDTFRKFLDSEYERTKNLIDDYDYEGGFVVVVYKLDPLYKKDYDKVKKSRYSQTSKAYQELFPKTVKVFKNGKNTDELSLQYRVFNKTADLRVFWEEKFGMELDESIELWDGFFEEDETLTPEKLKNYV